MNEMLVNPTADESYATQEEMATSYEGLAEVATSENEDNQNESMPSEDGEYVIKDEVYFDEAEDADSSDDEEKAYAVADEIDVSSELAALSDEFPELAGVDAENLRSKERYEKFRKMGLTPKEAYMATGEHRIKRRIPTSPISVTRQAEGIPDRQLRLAREIFEVLTDLEIQSLYKRVTK